MKLLFDAFPAIVFFIAYKTAGIYVATALLMASTVIQVLYCWFKYHKVDTMLILVSILVLIFGGATLFFHDAAFLQWKVSIINWLFAAAFLGSQLFTNKTLTQRLMEANLPLPNKAWKHLNLAWSAFFLMMGLSNYLVMTYCSMNTWVNFKVFGIMGLTILFVILQTAYLYRFSKDLPN